MHKLTNNRMKWGRCCLCYGVLLLASALVLKPLPPDEARAIAIARADYEAHHPRADRRVVYKAEHSDYCWFVSVYYRVDPLGLVKGPCWCERIIINRQWRIVGYLSPK
jgi:hypothetical protein